MSDTLTPKLGVDPETLTVLHLDVYLRQTDALGATGKVGSKSRAEAAGISRSTQYRWLRGRAMPDLDKAREVAERLGVKSDELFIKIATP